MIELVKKKLDEMDKEMGGLSPNSQKQYISKVKTARSDYEIKKSLINKIDEKITQQKNLQKFSEHGATSRSEAQGVERDAIKNLHQSTDYQEGLLVGINKDLIQANGNIVDVSKEIKTQEEQIQRIHLGVNDATVSVKRTDRNINAMNRRTICVKVLLHILAILLFLSIIIVFIAKLTRKK